MTTGTKANGSAPTRMWVDVCAVGSLVPGRGVCALVGTDPVAIFLVPPPADAPAGAAPEPFALSNLDPFSGASVLSRGIVGSRGERLKVSSPVYKQSFDLRTGECLDDPTVRLATYAVRIADGRVEVQLP